MDTSPNSDINEGDAERATRGMRSLWEKLSDPNQGRYPNVRACECLMVRRAITLFHAYGEPTTG